VTKDGSELLATLHFDIFRNSEFFIDNARRSAGLQPDNCGPLFLFTAGFGASASSEVDGLSSWNLPNPVALINREDT
jgi:hypothetical protein